MLISSWKYHIYMLIEKTKQVTKTPLALVYNTIVAKNVKPSYAAQTELKTCQQWSINIRMVYGRTYEFSAVVVFRTLVIYTDLT